MIKGVMFDFSGTLLRVEPIEAWLDAALAGTGSALGEQEYGETVRRLTEYGALPGGPSPRHIPAHLEALWDQRDISAEQHRAAYGGLTRAAGITQPELEQALYERHMAPAAWHPYPDTAPTLRELCRRGLPVAVVS
ncbi:HAD family hydrolase, partial [Streptomyces sp. NPDC059538]|uniref:HAD family hydrolase n=1 Tax=Streptomyces sp. NPDC059538 TaxID=3346860 RepID=UPI00369210E0